MPFENFIDLEAVVKQWARKEYKALADRKQKKLLKKQTAKNQTYLDLRIDWSEVIFADTTVKCLNDDRTGKKTPSDANANAAATLKSSMTQSGIAGSAKPTMSCLFKTRFRNKTDRDQEYTMRTEKTTTSTFFTETESGYTKGIDLSITLKTPCEVLEANAGYHREYSLTNISGQEFTEELHWGVDSVVQVKKFHMAEAELVVFEEKKSGKFEIQTDISGWVYVNFTNIKNNNSLVMSVSDNICRILDEFVTGERENNKPMSFVEVDSDNDIVRITTKGECGFQFGIRQEVMVEQSPLKDVDAKKGAKTEE